MSKTDNGTHHRAERIERALTSADDSKIPTLGDDMSEPKTTDYCTQCGESPDSGTHLFKHEYVSPHALGSSPVSVEVDDTALVTAARLNDSLLGLAPPVPGAVRVKVEERPGMPQFGVFLGMILDEHGNTQAVVRLDHYGLMLKALHPSKVTPVTPDEEAAYKP